MFKTLLFQGIDPLIGISAIYLSLYFSRDEVILRLGADVEPLLDRVSTANQKDLEELCRFYAESC